MSLEDTHQFSMDEQSREIFIDRARGNIEESDVDSRMASTFIKNLRHLDKKPNPILIHLTGGGGGNWEDGMAMYDAITFSESFITILIYGHACSMSSIIPQAADYRVVMPNTYMMCHYGYDSLDDVHMNVRLWIAFNSSKLSKSLISIYASKMQNSKFVDEKAVKNNLSYSKRHLTNKLKDGDWYLTAEEMIYYGFADAIMGEKFSSVKELKNYYE